MSFGIWGLAFAAALDAALCSPTHAIHAQQAAIVEEAGDPEFGVT